MIRKHFRLRRRLVAGLVFALVVVPAAGAASAPSGSHSIPAVKSIEVVGEHGKVYAQLSRDQVEAMRWQAAADYYLRKTQTPVTTEHSFGASKQRPVEPTVVSVSPHDGFDWTDAGIGASVAFASLLGLSMLLIVSRRSRKGLDGSGIATA
jgi:hypothetical protein